MSMFKFGIRGRLYGGFGALVLLGAVLAGVAVWQLWAIDAQVAAMKVQSENAIRIAEITTELQATRRSMLNYIFDRDAAPLGEAERRLDRMTSLLDEAPGPRRRRSGAPPTAPPPGRSPNSTASVRRSVPP